MAEKSVQWQTLHDSLPGLPGLPQIQSKDAGCCVHAAARHPHAAKNPEDIQAPGGKSCILDNIPIPQGSAASKLSEGTWQDFPFCVSLNNLVLGWSLSQPSL